MNNSNEDIDLGPLVNSFGRGVKKITGGLIAFFQNLFRIKWKLIAYGLAFSVVGLGLSLIIPKMYRSNFTAISTGVTNEFHSDRISDLDQLISEENIDLLSEKLNMSLEDVSHLEEITYLEVKNYMIDSVNSKFLFKIEAKVSDNSVFDKLQPAIINYLSDVDYYKKDQQLRKKKYLTLIDKLQFDIEELDSIRLVVANNYQPQGNAGGFVFGEPLNPLDMYKEGFKLFNEQLQLTVNLENLEMIQVAKDFMVYNKPNFPKKWIFMSISFAVGVIIGMIKYSKK